MPKVKTQVIKKSHVKALKLEKKKAAPEQLAEDSSASDSENESLDSDQELQLAFKRKELTPGLNIRTEAPKVFVNDKEALERKLNDIYLEMEWVERLDVTTPKFLVDAENADGTKLVDNDFQRESLFLKQAKSAVEIALPRLKGFGILTKRAEDYFAEMSKSDVHMKKVRSTLLTKHAEVEKRDKIRKLRELKKMGKQIQVENEAKKAKAKKVVYKSEQQFTEANEGVVKKKKDEKKKNGKDSKKATFKEKKYGFGGRKKRSKYNTAESSADAFNKGKNTKKAGKSSFKKPANKNKPKQNRFNKRK